MIDTTSDRTQPGRESNPSHAGIRAPAKPVGSAMTGLPQSDSFLATGKHRGDLKRRYPQWTERRLLVYFTSQIAGGRPGPSAGLWPHDVNAGLPPGEIVLRRATTLSGAIMLVADRTGFCSDWADGGSIPLRSFGYGI